MDPLCGCLQKQNPKKHVIVGPPLSHWLPLSNLFIYFFLCSSNDKRALQEGDIWEANNDQYRLSSKTWGLLKMNTSPLLGDVYCWASATVGTAMGGDGSSAVGKAEGKDRERVAEYWE